ncbi:MAG: hypothetical protein LBU26_06765, partial [Synergistaceae bacterium]|nr:hypothetical protein [Synergistaceae bacterium]
MRKKIFVLGLFLTFCGLGFAGFLCDMADAAATPPSIEWSVAYGGSSGSDYANSVRQTADGGYIVAGYTSSTDGDVTDNHGSRDGWIIKLDAFGNLVAKKTLGGK